MAGVATGPGLTDPGINTSSSVESTRGGGGLSAPSRVCSHLLLHVGPSLARSRPLPLPLPFSPSIPKAVVLFPLLDFG